MKALLLLLLSTPALATGVTLVPSDPEALQQFLQKLAEDHKPVRWCDDCVTLYSLQIAGSLKSGQLTFALRGDVSGDVAALTRLFAAKPATDIDAGSTAIYWTGDSYAAVLKPGPFSIQGRLQTPRGEPVTLVVTGPVGSVDIAVGDAEVVGSALRRGVNHATYQLVPVLEGTQQEKPTVLRLQVERAFHLARDRTFDVRVSARGARPGQVIALPVAAGEQIEDLDPKVATLRGEGGARRIDWIAQSSEPTISYAGKWSEASIALAAPEGPVRETWEAQCDDPYLCSFEGNAETRPGATGHIYTPLPGQSLRITWRELQPMAGAHTVAQVAAITTRPVGDNLQQQLNLEWRSSSGGRIWLIPPTGAVLRSFKLNDTTVPILKDDRGAVHVQLPSGTSQLTAEWELADAAGLSIRPPVPQLSHPVATLWHVVSPEEHRTVLLAGGIPGSPRVTLWPDAAATLLIAAIAWWLARRGARPLAQSALWFVSAAGFAVLSPAAVLPLVALLAGIRLLGHAAAPRGIVRAFFELSTVAFVLLVATSVAFATLHSVLFDAAPIDIDSFVNNYQIPGLSGRLHLFWATFLGGAPEIAAHLPTPWVLTVPTLIVRLVWTAWAVVLALFCIKEGRLTLGWLRSYAGTVRRRGTVRPSP